MKQAIENEEVEATFLKDQLLASSRYAHNKDLINVLLYDGQEYAIKDVDVLISKYLKGGTN